MGLIQCLALLANHETAPLAGFDQTGFVARPVIGQLPILQEITDVEQPAKGAPGFAQHRQPQPVPNDGGQYGLQDTHVKGGVGNGQGHQIGPDHRQSQTGRQSQTRGVGIYADVKAAKAGCPQTGQGAPRAATEVEDAILWPKKCQNLVRYLQT